MNTVNDEKKALLLGLEQGVISEAEKIRATAKAAAEQRRAALEKQVSRTVDDARKRAEAQSASVRKAVLSGVNIEIKRNSMKQREEIVQEIIAGARKRIGELIGQPEYRDILVEWIAEAVVGLGVRGARVNASLAEKRFLDIALLADAAAKAGAVLGHEVSLRIDEQPPLAPQGVVVTSDDGHTAFNNQVKIRFARKQVEIRNRIHDELFKTAPGSAR